jgi:hypothetical protein
MKKDFGIIFWIHLLLIIAVWTSPFWVDWRIMLVVIVLLNLQFLILGGCYLTFLETGKDRDMTFYYYYLSKFFPHLNKKKTKIFIRYILPFLLLGIALIYQIGFDGNVFISLR